jgi:hypothetical protein
MNKKKELLIGKNLEEVAEILRNYEWRVVQENGIDYFLILDLNPERYNLYLESGLIVDVKFF